MSDVKSFWCKVFFSDFVFHYAGMSKREAAKDIKESIKALSKLSEEGDSFGAYMVSMANKRRESNKAKASRENGKNGGRPKGNKDTTPQPSAISTDGPRQAENGEAVATSPSCGGSAANSYAHDALDCLDDKSSNQAASNTGNAQPVACSESGKFKHDERKNVEGNTANVPPSYGHEDGILEAMERPNCGADAVNRKTTVDRKSATSAPLRPWKEVVEQSLGISENQSGTDKGVRPPNPVPGLLKKRRAAGSPLKPGTGPSPAARSLPKSMAEVSDFACSENLDYDDARLWWEQNFVERKGKDKDGRKITNWRGALIRFCASAKRKRESA